MNARTFLRPAALAAVCAGAALAQSLPVPSTLPASFFDGLCVPVHTEPAAGATGAEEVWAAGATYKASFHRGLELHLPNPAGASPHLAFRTGSASLDGRELLLQRAAARVAGSHRCELDHGVLVEAYDVLPHGVEQTFVLRERIVGDLVVTGALAGDFTVGTHEPAHQALDLVDAAGNRVVYGAATVIDACGDTLPIATSSRDGRISLHVPASWLAEAAFPVVIDPLLTPVTVHAAATLPVLAVAIDRDDRHGSANVAVAVERQFAANDRDLSFLLCDDDFSDPALVFSRITATDHKSPDVAYVGHADRWVFVWQDDLGGQQSCYRHLHQGADTAFSTTVTMLTSQSGGRQRKPKVGGNRGLFAQGDKALVVREWEAAGTTGNTGSTQVWASLIDAVTGNEAAPILVAGTANVDAEAPAVSKDSGDGSWVVAFQSWSNLLGTRWGIACKRVAPNGSMANGLLLSDRRTFQEHLIAPVVDGCDGRWLVGYQSVSSIDEPGKIDGDRGQKVYTQRFDWAEGIGSPTGVANSRYLVGGFDRDYRLDSVAHDTVTRSHWLPVARSWTSNTVRAYLLGHDGETRFVHDVTSGAALPAAVAFDDDGNRFLIAYAQAVAGGGQRVDCRAWVYPTQATPSIYGSQCGAGLMSWLNAFRIGSEFPLVRLLNGPANAFAMLMFSFDDANVALAPFGLPGCTLLIDPSQGTYIGAATFVTNAAGFASLSLPLPSTVTGFDLYFQWAVAQPAAPSGFATSQGLAVEIR
jgi:hypothetical protein